MAQQTGAQVLATELERVMDKIEVLYERGDDTLQLIDEAKDTEQVSERALRLPSQFTAGGKAGYYNADGGALGIGSGESYDVPTLSVVFLKMSFRQTALSRWATDSSKKAIISSAQRIVTEGMKQFRAFEDKQLNATASGSLGTISVISGTTLTITVPTGAQLVYENQDIQFYDSTQTTNKSAAANMTSTVLASDPVTAQTIVFDQVPGTLVVGDVLMPAGCVGANPTVLYSIKYHQNNATTGVWQNLNRAIYPTKLATSRVNGNSGALVPMQPELAINKIRKSLGLNEVGRMVAHMAPEQKHAWDQLSTTVQIIDRAKHESGTSVDMNPTSYKSFNAGNMHGIPIKVAQNADQTRIDFLDLSKFGKAVMNPMGFYKDATGKNWFTVYGADGSVATAMEFHYVHNFQLFSRSPRAGAYIDSLARPSGY